MARKTKEQIKREMQRAKKRVRDRNYRFRKMSPDRQRIAIAKDVLAMLEANKLEARQGTYLMIDGDDNELWDAARDWNYDDHEAQEPEDGKLHEFIAQSESCQVCGIGACFVGAVLRADGVKLSDMDSGADDHFMRAYLSEWFSREQLREIETAFECSQNFSGSYAAMRFGEGFYSSEERLAAIMKNIIDNGGQFRP